MEVDKTIMPAADVLSDKVRAFQLDQEASDFLTNRIESSCMQHIQRVIPLFVAICARRGVCCGHGLQTSNSELPTKPISNVHIMLMTKPDLSLLYSCDQS